MPESAGIAEADRGAAAIPHLYAIAGRHVGRAERGTDCRWRTRCVVESDQIAVLAELMRTLVIGGGADLQTAASWIAAPDEALDGLPPAMWVASGRDVERLATIARQDAARLAR
jgi:hypothetical protein